MKISARPYANNTKLKKKKKQFSVTVLARF